MANSLPILLLITVLVAITSANRNPVILLPSDPELKQSTNCPVPDGDLNYRPVIGIVSHPGDGASGRLSNATNVSYIASSYVKFVESAGARVIPLIYTEPPEILIEKLNLVNGVLFTGGSSKKGQYFEVVKGIFQVDMQNTNRILVIEIYQRGNTAQGKVLEKNDAGDHFPLIAICLGFELLTMIITKDNDILEWFNAANQASKLQFVEGANFEGTMFQRFPSELLKKLSKDCLVMQNHHYGISPETFQANADLSNFFKMLTTSADQDNKVYVSTVQAEHYPVTAVQWHPEKNAFEWGLSQIPHTEDAIQVTQHVANYFVSEARKSLNRPDAQKVLNNLIYNYSPSYSGNAGSGFDEVYVFTPHTGRSSL